MFQIPFSHIPSTLPNKQFRGAQWKSIKVNDLAEPLSISRKPFSEVSSFVSIRSAIAQGSTEEKASRQVRVHVGGFGVSNAD